MLCQMSDRLFDKNMDKIKDQIAVVTGGAAGIGYSCVQELLRYGAKAVVIFDLSTSSGAAAVEKLQKEFKDRALFIPCDVTDAEQLKNGFKKVVDTFKRVNILVNNAGILNEILWEKCVDINLKGLIRASLIALEYMGKHKGGDGGTIVNICSIAGLSFYKTIPIYCATKFGVYGFTGCMAENYDKTGVRFVCICPGPTETALVGDIPQRVLDLFTSQEVHENLKSNPAQKCDVVSQAIVKLIQEGQNGAAWVINGGEPPSSVKFPKYTDIGTPV